MTPHHASSSSKSRRVPVADPRAAYARAGVDVDAGDRAVELMRAHVDSTRRPESVGGLGGFVPPLIMGWVYGVEGSYAIGLMLLSDVALAAAVYTAIKMRALTAAPADSTSTASARPTEPVVVPARK